ncbi:MAG: hypothetical protein O2797_00460 [Bacteroidetes bacterium]|nr:hypothetical protein [Bacteroidota bacterium]MDA1332671.1 hypothetical protein [Bacteroidota bacterium]
MADKQLHHSGRNSRAHSLSALTDHASHAVGIKRSDLNPGDVIMLYTRNSVYTARFMEDGRFAVSGGWFDQHYDRAFVTSITGCTWGGKCINREFVGSCGMRVEFGNRVLTSVLQRVVCVPRVLMN